MSFQRRGRRGRARSVGRPRVGLGRRRTILRRRTLRWIAGRSAHFYLPGDMRRSYRWTRRAAMVLLVGAATVLTGRLLLTGLFVDHVSGDLPLIAIFNLGLTATAATVLLGVAVARGWLRRWWRYRVVRGTAPPPKPL